jgi:hypothetical protein
MNTPKKIVTPEEYTGTTTLVHLHNHTVYSTLDGVSTPEQYANQCALRGYPAMSATEHGHMGSVPDMYMAFKKVGLKFIAGCFLPNQPVYSMAGVKEMSEIAYDDYVLTHNSNFRRVNNVQVRPYRGDLIRIKAWGVEDQLCTPEHPFMVREVIRTEEPRGVWHEQITLGWRRANELLREKYGRTYHTKRSRDRSNKRHYRFYLCVPRLPRESKIETLRLADYIFTDRHEVTPSIVDGIIESVTYRRNNFRTSKPVGLPASVDLDNELLWVMGLWLAEGSISDGGPLFSLGLDEYHFYERIAAYFADFGINTTCRTRDGDNESRKRAALDVQVYSRYFGRLFTTLFGEGFANKKLKSEWLIGLGADQAAALVNGIFDGDAKIGTQQSILKMNNRTLVWQVRLLMTKMSEPQHSAITPLPCNNSDNTSYCIRRRESGHYDYDDTWVYLPVYDIQRESYDGDVYNIEVDRDNSYYTGVAAHNCEVYFCDYEPERQKLGKDVRRLKVEDPERYYNLVRARHLTLLVKNQIGYTNLIKLTTQAYRTGFYYRPRIWYDKLLEHKEGLIVLSGCLNGPVCHELRRVDQDGNPKPRLHSKDERGAVDWVKRFKRDFGDDYKIETQMPGIPGDDVVFRKLVAVADFYKIDLVMANDCWNKETTVQTDHGSKQLCDLKVGDLVWTHRGRLREVVQIGKRKVRPGESIYGFLGSTAIQCTGNHKLLVYNSGKPVLKAVEAVANNDYMAVTRIPLPIDDLISIKISDFISDPRLYVTGAGVVHPIGGRSIKPVADVLPITDDLLWIMGMYIAEGSTDAGYRLSFGHHSSEQRYYNKICEFFAAFGFNPDVMVNRACNGVATRICSSPFTRLFAATMGHSVYQKHLPPFWTKLSLRQLRLLLRGYCDGDGYHKGRSFFTVSIQLFTDLIQAFAAIGVGVTPSLRRERHMIINNKKRGKIKTFCNQGYTGSIGKTGMGALGYDVTVDRSKIRRNWFLDDNLKYVWIKNPFKRIDSNIAEVWCIEVEDDHTFLMGVSSSNCHYLEQRDFELQKVMMAIDQGLPINSPDLFHVNSNEQYMKTRAELWARFRNGGYNVGLDDGVFERACDNTLAVADCCEILKIDTSPKIPTFEDADNKLAKLLAKRLRDLGLHKIGRRFLIDGKEVTYVEQVKIELERIIEKGYSSYFLITHDLINYGSARGWPFSPRGSAGGSVTNYLLGISPIDPLPWGLSFDRFLSPSRGGFMLNLGMPKPAPKFDKV